MNQRPGTHGLLQHMCFDGRKSTCFKHIVCAPLFIANVKAHVLFSEIGSVLFTCAIFKGETVLPTELIQRE